jgi:hypothetical protein
MCLLAAAGCHRASDPIVGTWKGAVKAEAKAIQMPATETFDFNSDGSYTATSVVLRPGTTIRVTVTDKGTWKKLGENRYETLISDTNAVVDGASAAGKKRAESKFRSNKATLIASANKNPGFTVKWIDQNNAVVTPDQNKGEPLALHRDQ